MTINPRLMTTNPEARVWDEINTLRKRVQTLERADAVVPQHGGFTDSVGGSGYSGTSVAPKTFGSPITLNIPGENYRILFRLYFRQVFLSNNTSTWLFALRDTDPNSNTFDTTVGKIVNDSANQYNIGTFTLDTTLPPGGGTNFGQDLAVVFSAPWPGIVPGEHVLQPIAYRSAGTATMAYAFCYFWVAAI